MDKYPAICSQCGQKWNEPACGPTHATIWNEMRITVDIPDPIMVLFSHLILQPNIQRGWYGRAEIYDPTVTIKSENLYFSLPARIDSFSKLECGEGMYIGKYVHIASFAHLGIGGGLLILEQGSSCASGVKIITGSNQPGDGHGCSAIDPNAIIKRSFVHVKRNATLYTNVVVCPGVTIGEGAVVLPGAVVTKNVLDGETWGGVPAKRIKGKESEICGDVEVHELCFRQGERCTYCEKMPDKIECDPSCGCGVEVKTTTCPACSTRMDLGSMQCGYCGKVVTLEVSARDQSTKSIGEQSLDMWTAAQAEMYCWDEDESKDNKS